MYKFSIALVRKFVSIQEFRPTALLGMVLSSLTENVFFNIAAAMFLILVHLPLLVFQDENKMATVGSASLVTGGLAKIGLFIIPLAKVELLTAATIYNLSSLAPAIGNFIFSILNIQDVKRNQNNKTMLARDTALTIGRVSATIFMSLPLWGSHLWLLASLFKIFIIISATAAIALMLALRYEKKNDANSVF